MYYLIVAAFMFVLPVGSVALESIHTGVAVSALRIIKWFVFWSVGCRLLMAGARQIAQPQYTAREILGIKSDDSLILVRELGFANAAMGLGGVLSIFNPAWQPAAALTGGVFYGLAGINHVLQKHNNRLESAAMVSDLFASLVLLSAITIWFFGR